MQTSKGYKTKPDSVKVCIRMRPLLQHEDAEFWQIDEETNKIYTKNAQENHSELLSTYSNSLTNQANKDIKRALMDSLFSPQCFAFDRTYSINTNSQTIYKEMCRDITKSVIKGFNCSIFMYGQTTSGKTFTMLGSPNSPGILPCSLRDVFNLIQKEPNPENFTVYCSYVEIYNENIHDLLTDANYLKLIDDNKYGVVVAGAKRVRINNFEDGIGIKDFGEENRKYRETLINEYSSRSHTIFQIFVESVEIQQNNEKMEYAKSRFSCLNLIDLAGSERINEYDSKNEGSGETGYINKSLFVLANVINRLAESKGNKTHIPYRDSKLTRLLSQALGGNSLTAIICTVSPAALNYYQTLSTLRFATRAKNVKLKPSANEILDDKAKLEFYKNEIKKLRSELKSRKGPVSTNNEQGEYNTYPENNNNNMRINDNFMTMNNQQNNFERILQENQSLNNELTKLKELYRTERVRSESYKEELNKIRAQPNLQMTFGSIGNNNNNNMSITQMKNNQGFENNNNNKDSIFIDDLISQYNNTNDISAISYKNNTSQWKEESFKISNEYKNQLQNLQNQYSTKVKNLHNELFKVDPSKQNEIKNQNNMVIHNTNEILNNNDFETNKQQLVSNIITGNPNNNDNNNENNNNTKMSSLRGGNQPQQQQEKKSNNIQLLQVKEKKTTSNNNNNNQSESDDIISKISSGNIFDSVILNFIPNNSEHFEDNIKLLKQNYENKLDALEKTMDYYKSYIENYYRKKIQMTRNTNMDSVELIEGNLPIMQITEEHNDMLKKLRELNDSKIKELETSFFANLRAMTAKRMEDISK